MRASGSLQPTLVTCVLWQGREEGQRLWMAYERVRKDRVSSGTANHILWWCICNSSFLNRQELVVLEVTMPWSVWMWNTIFFCCVSSSECMQFTARTGIRQSLSHNRPYGYWYMEIFFYQFNLTNFTEKEPCWFLLQKFQCAHISLLVSSDWCHLHLFAGQLTLEKWIK